jgi:hypothetical protein
VFHLFAYLKTHTRSRTILDDSRPQVDESHFIQADWAAFYPEAAEAIPLNAPEPHGESVIIFPLWDPVVL